MLPSSKRPRKVSSRSSRKSPRLTTNQFPEPSSPPKMNPFQLLPTSSQRPPKTSPFQPLPPSNQRHSKMNPSLLPPTRPPSLLELGLLLQLPVVSPPLL